MQRRTILKMLAGSSVISAPIMAANPKPNKRRKRGGVKKLLVIFQRGGNDSLNTMIPTNATEYNFYRNLRPTLGIPSNQLLSIPGDSFFGLHPAMAPLIPAIQAGDMSLIHAVGYPGADRSHFESQSYYETGIPGNTLISGWLNRYLEFTTGTGLIRGAAIGSNIPQSVSGSVAVPVSNNFGNSTIAVDGTLNPTQADAFRQTLSDIYDLTPSSGNESVYETGDRIFQMIESFSTRNLSSYAPENGATYPDTGFGRRVMHAAQMMKDTPDFLGLEVVTLNQNGYDTHSNQITAGNPTNETMGHGRLLGELAGAMAAFYDDMGTRMADTMVLVISEFGRRAYQNDSFGSDHGTGALAMVMGGGGVAASTFGGGGPWPGLSAGNLKDGGDLDWTIDYRDIYWEILAGHFGLDNATMDMIIPSHTYNPVGFM